MGMVSRDSQIIIFIRILFRFEDTTEFSVTNIWPAQLSAKGKNNFRARAIFENLPAWFANESTDVKLSSSITFLNGSTWSYDYNVNIYKAKKLATDSDAYKYKESWLVCKDGWKKLPSGKVICYVESSKDHTARKEYCEKAGAYLMEIRTRDEAQSLLYFMFTIAKTSTSSFALGAIAKTVGNQTVWVWEQSGEEVDGCAHGCLLKTSSEDVDVTPTAGMTLYMDPTNNPSSTSQYMDTLPYFDLYIRSAADTDATYFICMKDGENSAANAATFSISPKSSTDAALSLKSFDIMEIDYTLKTAHRTQFPFSLEVSPGSSLKICKLKLKHVGKNFPCVTDPTYGFTKALSFSTLQNSTALEYYYKDRQLGAKATLQFLMLSNWGRLDYLKQHFLQRTSQELATWTMIIQLTRILSKLRPSFRGPLKA